MTEEAPASSVSPGLRVRRERSERMASPEHPVPAETREREVCPVWMERMDCPD